MTAQVFSSTMSQHPFPSAYSSPMATPSPSKENHFPSFPSYPASTSSKDAASTSSQSDAERSRTSLLETSRANEVPAPRSQRGTSSRRPSRPRLHSLQSLNSGPASPSLTEQDSGHAYISTARFLSTHPSLSRASSRNAVETLQPLAESSVSASNPFHKIDVQPRSGESSKPRLATSPDSGLSEFGQMGAPFGERGAFLRRSHTITSGISSMGSKRMEEAPFRRSPPESAVTFGPRSGRNAPKLGPRRQTVSNVSPTPADRPEVKRTNTAVTPVLSYSPTSEAVASTPAASTLRPRPTLPPNQLEAKVVILGSQGVGKTSLVHRYTSGHFTLSSTPSTIGASFHTKKLIVDSVKVRLQLWDTAGQERFRSMAPMYYRGSHAAVIVYDITSRASFMDVRGWLDELRRNMTSGLVVHVVGAKGDLARKGGSEVELEWARETVRSWLQPTVQAGADVESEEGSPTRSSRLSGLGSLAMGSASRAFANSTWQNPAPKANSTASTASGSTVSDTREQLDWDPTWDAVEVSEVSAKSDRGIEEVFLAVTKKLVEKRAQIEQERKQRERNSIFLSASDNGEPEADAITVNSWTCCG
ncbi:Small GTPase superfamily [Kalmanozyma brasiliensis GHG001]|uniref:Small GTPase superfamily n=1 Tax=Kalmanozyma brasiliensis (strain GHG001) TaxID=1365824 RepID=UPI002868154E|nr:Small GTPase superfamily [Kalmanozyma brasiliensis GHG001]EST06976.2 Small GTPase superfamily [Kalmanozyma brasiliensis GHG001]